MAFFKKKRKVENEVNKDFSVNLTGLASNGSFMQENTEYTYYKAKNELINQTQASIPSTGNTYIGLFDKTNADEEKPKSIAKQYGTKYMSDGVQLASSKVVDVRSYKKPEVKEETKFDLEPQIKETPLKRGSFFDDLLKSLEEDDDVKSEIPLDSEPVVIKEEPKVKVAKKVVSPKKKKKSIDMDIISGDFGGVDIL